jgi:hypothetical protein
MASQLGLPSTCFCVCIAMRYSACAAHRSMPVAVTRALPVGSFC